MHLGRATDKAVRLTRNGWLSYAVVHYGKGEYFVIRLETALEGFPSAIRRFTWRELGADGLARYWLSENTAFDKGT